MKNLIGRYFYSMLNFFSSYFRKKYRHKNINILVIFILSFIILLRFKMNKKGPIFAIDDDFPDSDEFSNVKEVLDILGFTENDEKGEWDLLWTWEYQKSLNRFSNLKPHKIINHMPGIRYITRKNFLSTMGFPFMPKAFNLPDDKEIFLSYAANNSDKYFLEKANTHRRIAIIKPKDYNLETNKSFIQEFIMNPLLIDGYKFDIGVFFVLTSVNPLRLYMYTGDIFIRFCLEKYHPFDPKVLQKYVIGGYYRQIWEIPSMMRYLTLSGDNMRSALNAYLFDHGKDPAKIWEQIEEIMRFTALANVQNMSLMWKPFHTRNLFELIRVDMIIDEDLKVHLIEANLSPRLFTTNKKLNILNKQVLYNIFYLVGVGTSIKEHKNKTRFAHHFPFITSDTNLISNINECVQNNCRSCYAADECSLCIPCLNESDYDILAHAHYEHLHRGDMRRIFPKAITDVEKFNLEEETKNLMVRDKWMTKWFYHKCLFDRSWCQ